MAAGPAGIGYPQSPEGGQVFSGALGALGGVARNVDRAFAAHLQYSATEAALGGTTSVHAAVSDNGNQQTITTGFTAPSCPRNITATVAASTAAHVKAVAVTVFGTNDAGDPIQETLPVFTDDTPGTVVGNKAFKTVTSWVLPAMDGATANTSLGVGSKLGIPHKLPHNTFLLAFLANVKEGTAPTVAISATILENNTFILNSALNGTVVDLYYYA